MPKSARNKTPKQAPDSLKRRTQERRRPSGERETIAAPVEKPRAEAIRLLAEIDALKQELKVARRRMRDLESAAEIDPLLGIYNRRGFGRELTRALAYARRYGARAALVYIDLDQFKPVNDRYGHAAGDALLQAVTARLSSEIRSSDMLARIGGDEFVALLWNVSEGNAMAKAETLELAIADTRVTIGCHEVSVGASAGVAMLDARGRAADLLARADAAMYARKAERRALITR